MRRGRRAEATRWRWGCSHRPGEHVEGGGEQVWGKMLILWDLLAVRYLGSTWWKPQPPVYDPDLRLFSSTGCSHMWSLLVSLGFGL